uniref:Uncharacterized protein n=1 Tax=Globisporangium ultimum (strain ATCC 200006 / CBS 805.95 / DAOM BR144) TaxID=431595 RepID=K3XDC0_GLOUD
MENPASASSLPSEQLPRVASGLDSGFAPTIQPGPTDGSSPSESSQLTRPPPRAPPATHLVVPPSPPSSPLPAPTVPGPVAAVDPDDVLMDTLLNALSSTPDAPPADVNAAAADPDDEPMHLPHSRVDAASPSSRVDTRPSMADLLAQQETIRRDNAGADAARCRVETPKPLACDIEAIERSTPPAATGRSSRLAWSKRD